MMLPACFRIAALPVSYVHKIASLIFSSKKNKGETLHLFYLSKNASGKVGYLQTNPRALSKFSQHCCLINLVKLTDSDDAAQTKQRTKREICC